VSAVSLGVSLAFPKRKVLALDSDGSLLLDTSSLVTVATVNPSNFLAIVFDNQAYADMGPTATAGVADLEKIAHGAGIKQTRTVRSVEDFQESVKAGLETPGLAFFVVKVAPGKSQVRGDSRRIHGRPMKEAFIDALQRHPDYPKRVPGIEPQARSK
jgi:thiamine pyrophosphate-dependent acetolactate synthase large subunit-like protein